MKSTIFQTPLRGFVLSVAVLFVAILATYYGADWWKLNDAPGWPGSKLMLLRVCAALLVALSAATLIHWLARCGKRGRLFFAAWLLGAVLLYAAVWPGYLMSDSVSALAYGLAFPFNLWLGFFTPFYTSAVLQLVPHIAALTAVQLLGAAAVLAYASETIAAITGKIVYALVFAACVVFSPALVYNLGLQARDTLFSLLVLWLAVFVVRIAHPGQASRSLLLLGGAIAGLAAGIRSGDGWLVLLPLVAIVLWLVRERRRAVMFLGSATVAVAVFVLALPAQLGHQDDAFAYKVANTVNPLGYVMQSKFATDQRGNLSGIAKVVNVEQIRTLQTPYEIPAWWSGGLMLDSATAEQRAAYVGHVTGYLRENIGIFVAGRVHTFAGASGLSPGGFKVDDLYAAHWPTDWVAPTKYNVDLAAGRPFPALSGAAKSWFDNSVRFDPALTSGSAVFWNVLPWIALLLAVICFGPRMPGLRLAALLVFARVPVVFLTAPASQFKYYLPVVLSGGFILALALARLFQRQQVRPANPAGEIG